MVCGIIPASMKPEFTSPSEKSVAACSTALADGLRRVISDESLPVGAEGEGSTSVKIAVGSGQSNPEGFFRLMLRNVAPAMAVAFIFFWNRDLSAQTLQPSVLTHAAQVRQLSPEEAGQHIPVRLRGVITFFNQSQFFRFIQDDTAGIYFFMDDSTNRPRIMAGQEVEIEGATSPGEYAPIVTVNQIHVLGEGTFPAAQPVSYEDLASGEEDSQFVEINGIVRSVTFDPQTEYYSI